MLVNGKNPDASYTVNVGSSLVPESRTASVSKGRPFALSAGEDLARTPNTRFPVSDKLVLGRIGSYMPGPGLDI